MTKDILTREKIKQDYNHNSFRDTIPLIIIPTVLLLPIVGLIVAIMSFEKNNDMIGYLLVCFLGLFLILLLLLVAALCIASFIKARKNYRTIENDEFEVISDRLIDTEEKYQFSLTVLNILNCLIILLAKYQDSADKYMTRRQSEVAFIQLRHIVQN